MTSKPPLPTRTRTRARELRADMTQSEMALWRRLRGFQLDGYKFRRQHPVPPYVADFFCAQANLLVEIDGSQHSPAADAIRTRFLESRGLRILRFASNDVLQQTDAVVEAIRQCLVTPTLTPTPLPVGEGLKSEDVT